MSVSRQIPPSECKVRELTNENITTYAYKTFVDEDFSVWNCQV